MGDFRTLTDPAKINIKPDRIQVETAPRSARLQELFDTFKLPKDKYNELALLNNKDLNTRLEKGDRFKIVSK